MLRRSILGCAALLPVAMLVDCTGTQGAVTLEQAKAYLNDGVNATLAASQAYLASTPAPSAQIAAYRQISGGPVGSSQYCTAGCGISRGLEGGRTRSADGAATAITAGSPFPWRCRPAPAHGHRRSYGVCAIFAAAC